MEEKRFPQLEKEENEGIVSDPMVEMTSPTKSYTDLSVHINTREDWNPGIGPFSVDELNSRIDEADAALDRYSKGDDGEWVTEKQLRENYYTKYTWLR